MNIEISDKAKQVAMHKSMFDRSREAIDQGFYLEAVFIEYAAIESRLEVMLGVLGAPCNRYLPPEERKKYNISQRVACLKRVFDSNESIFGKSKLTKKDFTNLKNWLEKRNRYVHGLFKREIEYKARLSDKALAEAGLEICTKLYNETNRLKRLSKQSPELFEHLNACAKGDCRK